MNWADVPWGSMIAHLAGAVVLAVMVLGIDHGYGSKEHGRAVIGIVSLCSVAGMGVYGLGLYDAAILVPFDYRSYLVVALLGAAIALAVKFIGKGKGV